MKVFIWKRLEKVTDNYHPEGGLVVFAEDIERAITIANEVNGVCLSIENEPTRVSESEGIEQVIVFRDAGCC